MHIRQARTVSSIAALLFATTMSPARAADEGTQVLGRWELTAALDASEVTALDEQEAQQLVGQVFTIARDRVQLGTRTCLAPALTAERVEPRLYLREHAHAAALKLGLPTPVTVVDLGCTSVFIKKPGRLVIHWKGWFFDTRKLR